MEYEASREPYEDEKLLCNALISYLQRYMSNINGLIESDLSQISVEPQTSQQGEHGFIIGCKGEHECNYKQLQIIIKMVKYIAYFILQLCLVKGTFLPQTFKCHFN